MATNISGKTFDPRNDFSNLVIGQGKLTLDSEQNEASAALDRRWRVETMDLAGRAGYPDWLPDSFRIGLGPGGLQIGPGRFYVDGFLAENHGLTAAQGGTVGFDAAHEELRSTTAIPFDQQPYDPGAVQPDPGDGNQLIYLVAWRREVTHLKDPSLVEPAVGVDTAGRHQTAWQVRALPVPDNVDCSTPDEDIPGWPAIISPSTIRLTNLLVPVSDPENPCEVPSGQPLRTTENRTYRVASHGIAPDGRPLLKWSRTNESVATRVLTIDSATQLTVAEVARDDVHRFSPGDWIEIADDRLELSGDPNLGGQPGLMRMVETADPATNVITFQSPIPAGTFAVDPDGVPNPDLNLRITRWDQSGEVRASGGALLEDLTDPLSPGVFPAPPAGEFVELEAGIAVEISFAPGPQQVRTGDHWIFRARAVTGTIDPLETAPPCATHYHFARLAVVQAGTDGFVDPITDCRDPIDTEEDCCCTFVVRPGESIQTAIDQLPPAGGCVCLKPGVHQLQQPILINRSNVTLKGEAKGVVVRAAGGDRALILQGVSASNPIERLRIQTITFSGDDVPANNGGLLDLLAAEDVIIEDCAVTAQPEEVGIAVRLAACQDVTISDCQIETALTGVLCTVRCADIQVLDCEMNLGRGDGVQGFLGVGMDNGNGALIVRGTTIRNSIAGVIVNDNVGGPPASLATGSQVTDCLIELVNPGGEPDPASLVGVDMASELSEVSGNRISYPGLQQVGIRIGGAHCRVADNACHFIQDQPSLTTVGIVIGVQDSDDDLQNQIIDVQVTGNSIEGPQSGILGVSLQDALISQNRIEGDTGGISVFGVAVSESTGVEINSNTVVNALLGVGATECARLTISDNRIEGGLFGMLVATTASPTITGNQLTDISGGGMLIGATTARTVVRSNRVVRCGFGVGTAIGIGLFLVLGEAVVSNNEVMDIGEGGDEQSSAIALGITGDFVLEALIEGNLVTYTGGQVRDVANEDRALRFRGLLEAAAPVGDRLLVLGFPVKMLGNSFIGTGATALVEILSQSINDNFNIRFERVTFSDNYCMHFAPPQTDQNNNRATVALRGRRGAVVGNQIKSFFGQHVPVNFNGMSSTYVGNVGEQPPTNGATVPTPPNNFNLDT